MNNSEQKERSLAVFIDFENLALGFKGKQGERFDIAKVLDRLLEKGKIIVKRAYADWNSYKVFISQLHSSAIELTEIPRRGMAGKNSADIRLCVDSIDLCYSKEHIDTFVILSGDSDFSPLVSKLKENGKWVIGVGMRESTSDLFRDNCDEFIYYEDLEAPETRPPQVPAIVGTKKRPALQLLVETVAALLREGQDILWSSMVKDTMKRKKPSFSESYHGYSSFSSLLEDAQRLGLISIHKDARSGTYVVDGFAGK